MLVRSNTKMITVEIRQNNIIVTIHLQCVQQTKIQTNMLITDIHENCLWTKGVNDHLR